MKRKTKHRRKFTRDAKWALRKLQELKEHLRGLRDVTAHDREPELDAMIGLLTVQQDSVLDGNDLDEKKACQQLLLVNAFTRSVWGELGVIVDD